ncbi:MAG: hypothetical protein C5S44_02415 [Candidatus Methanocomedens sp.]|nr:MAG: hypothetical protein C5S44_02415 [ANME-2 cluster archaeon]
MGWQWFGVLWVVGYLYIIGVCCGKYVLIFGGSWGREGGFWGFLFRNGVFLYDFFINMSIKYNAKDGQDV